MDVEAVQIVITVFQLLLGLCIILMVLFQSGKSEGLGVIGGAADTFLAKSKGKGMDAKLARARTHTENRKNHGGEGHPQARHAFLFFHKRNPFTSGRPR